VKIPQTYHELLDGWVFLVDKPLHWTSFDVVNKFKGLIKKFKQLEANVELKNRKVKVGHSGTLDPLATGLLIVCVGKMTKQIDQYQGGKKRYIGKITLGQITKSYDLETIPEGEFPWKDLVEEEIERVAKSFIGVQMQTPPIFSAKQVNGKRAYEHARAGSNIKLNPSQIEIFQFNLNKISLPVIEFDIICSKGTYIRSIAHEFGIRLDSGSYLSELRRVESVPFKIEDALTIEKWIEKLSPNVQK
jgi:tRNA pseudouridine55 synthase